MNTTFLPEAILHCCEEDWLEEKFHELSKGKYLFADKRQKGKYRKEFWRIAEAEKENNWKQINFHFELDWSGSVPISKADAIRVAAHLECQHLFDAQKNQEIRAHFDGKQENTFCTETIPADFSSEEAAIDTLNRIIAVLEKNTYRTYAQTADLLTTA